MTKFKHILTCALFFSLIIGLSIYGFALKDETVSASERRNLATPPVLSTDSVFSGDYMTDLDKYLLDQFPRRDDFRSIKAYILKDIFCQKDNNGIFAIDNGIYKLNYPLQEDQIIFGAEKFNTIKEKYLQGSNVFYSIIPDKNYYLPAKNNVLTLDYQYLADIMAQTLKDMSYINLFDSLTLEDYYKTDSHWRQEKIYPIAQEIADAMGVTLSSFDTFTPNSLGQFHGVYWGQSALHLPSDELVYMTNSATDKTTVYSEEFGTEGAVYSPEKFEDVDPYDVFLSGAQAILTLTNPEASTDRELIIFRDSFGSSLSPYFTGAYKKITLIDIRYVASDYLAEFVDFHGQDALFIYSATMLNSGKVLR